jgi:hypothetical protein
VSEVAVDWTESVMVDGYSINLGATDNGKWLAAHKKPYFCFEADTRLGAIDLAARALAWYRTLPSTLS